MTQAPKNDSRSAGSLLAIAIIAGVAGGTVAGQTTIGFLIGLAVGLAMLGLVWAADKYRGR